MDFGTHEFGGGPEHAAHAGGVDVTELHGPAGSPDERFTLTAQHARIRLSSGRTVDALAFGDTVPGPELRVRQGDLVEVTLRNRDVEDGVSIHWHSVDVPNAEDGVSGVTQDAVLPGRTTSYRFRAEQVGTFWYHTHQSSADRVRRGLYGVLVIEPRLKPADELDLAVVAHDLGGSSVLNGAEGVTRRTVEPDTPVRLRLVNTHSTPLRLVLDGTPFRVVAIDGTDLNRPEPLEDRTLELAGGSYDLAFRCLRPRCSWRSRTGRPPRAQPERPRRAAALQAEASVRSARLRRAPPRRPSARRPTSTASSSSRSAASRGSSTGGPACIGRSTAISRRARLRRVGRRLRQGDDPQRHEVRASDAPARPPHAGAEPKRRAGVR